LLEQLLTAFKGMEIVWHEVKPSSGIIGKTVANVSIRDHTGASVIAVKRGNDVLANPKSAVVFEAGDVIGMIGDEEQVVQARKYLQSYQPEEHIAHFHPHDHEKGH
jgi:K+/H+ antiporter YhaU regulatory subunit KhtT